MLQIQRCWLRCGKQEQAPSTKTSPTSRQEKQHNTRNFEISAELRPRQKLTFSVRFEVAVDGWWCDITEAAGPVTQGGAAPLAGR